MHIYVYATHCNTLWDILTCRLRCVLCRWKRWKLVMLSVSLWAAHCNTLHHTATHCNALQHAATPCNTLQHPANSLSIHTAMGWLPLVDSLKLQVSFAKEPNKRDDILQKRPVILWNLLIVATPYRLTQATKSTLQHSARLCITLHPAASQQAAAHLSTLQCTATFCNTLQYTEAHWNKMWHTVSRCITTGCSTP